MEQVPGATTKLSNIWKTVLMKVPDPEAVYEEGKGAAVDTGVSLQARSVIILTGHQEKER